MLKVTWIQADRLVITGISVGGYTFPLFWDIPVGVNVDHFLETHSYMDDGAQADIGVMTFDDENSIEWGPTVPDDNWCSQPVKVIGQLTYAAANLQLAKYSYFYEYWHCDCVNLSGTRCAIQPIHILYSDGGTADIYPYPNAYMVMKDRYGKVGYEWKNFSYSFSTNRIDYSYDWYYNGQFLFTETGHQSNTSFSRLVVNDFETIDPINIRDNYYSMIHYCRSYFRYHIEPKLRTQVYEWCATLDAVQGFHPYDINLVEALFQFGIEDIVPIGTSNTILDILNTAVNSRGGLTSPTGIVFLAQIFANSYLYYKYVALGDFTDISEIVVGTDKPVISDYVRALRNADPNYVPSNENQKLMRLAQLIVHRDKRLLSAYGFYGDSLVTQIGDVAIQQRARLKAYPSYYKDMSTAALICEEIGLSLSIERLAAVVPYEFIAQWFLPIEETIRSVENNASRLSSMYEVKNLCLSQKVIIPLDINYLKAMFGLSDAEGSLTLKNYTRHSQVEFPPTTPDLSLRPSISMSRVMQGSSLLITRL